MFVKVPGYEGACERQSEHGCDYKELALSHHVWILSNSHIASYISRTRKPFPTRLLEKDFLQDFSSSMIEVPFNIIEFEVSPNNCSGSSEIVVEVVMVEKWRLCHRSSGQFVYNQY